VRILLVEPWLHGSHRQWAEGYRSWSRHRVDIIGLPGGRWRWLLQGGALPLAEAVRAWVADHGQPDLVVVSGMVDVAHLLALSRRWLDRQPVVVFQHESQLVYPGRRAEEQEAALRNWLSWCAADLVVFNSCYHREAVTRELPGFLDRFPEPGHGRYLDAVLDRFDVLPVGVHTRPFRSPPDEAGCRTSPAAGDGDAPPVILWPHRWERDKDPDAFSAALAKVVAAGLDFRLVLAGEDPPSGDRYTGRVRRELVQRFADRVAAVGPFPVDRYRELVLGADIVVSCARHEFFGVGVVEAVAAGCRPVLPAGLSYPELIPGRWHEVALYRPGRFGTALVAAVEQLEHGRTAAAGLAAEMEVFGWDRVAPRYDDRFEQLT